MGEIRDNVQNNLSFYLSLKQISQKKLAEMLHVSQSAVTNWVKGKNSPDIETVAQICNILNINVTQLFGTDYVDEFSLKERTLILHYRQRPDLQKAVDILLDLNDKLFENEDSDAKPRIL